MFFPDTCSQYVVIPMGMNWLAVNHFRGECRDIHYNTESGQLYVCIYIEREIQIHITKDTEPSLQKKKKVNINGEKYAVEK